MRNATSKALAAGSGFFLQSNKLIARLVAACLLAIALATIPASAKPDYYVLALQSDGQASVIVDEGTHTAYLIDLGRKKEGERLLFTQGTDRFGGKPMLRYLAEDRAVEHLVIVCSHPHSDHMGGIESAFSKPKEC